MSRYSVGSVPYVNARPLVAQFLDDDRNVTVIETVPSGLPSFLDSGEFQAILVSSIELMRPGRVTVGNVGIVSHGAVESVRIVSHVAWKEIRTLSPDPASMTSNALAQILLREDGIEFQLVNKGADAIVLIGDAGFRAKSLSGFHYDLGEKWAEQTDLPFVWARWVSNKSQPELGELLNGAYEWSLNPKNRQSMIKESARAAGWTFEEVDRYLTECVSHTIGAQEEAGFARFTELCQKHCLKPEA